MLILILRGINFVRTNHKEHVMSKMRTDAAQAILEGASIRSLRVLLHLDSIPQVLVHTTKGRNRHKEFIPNKGITIEKLHEAVAKKHLKSYRLTNLKEDIDYYLRKNLVSEKDGKYMLTISGRSFVEWLRNQEVKAGNENPITHAREISTSSNIDALCSA